MRSLAQRLPPRKQVLAVFLAVLFPVHFWAWVVFLRELPSYLMRMHLWDIIGVLAYTQVVALLDSLLLMTAILLLTLVLPRRWLGENFQVTAVLLGYAFVLAVIPLHTRDLVTGGLAWIRQPWFIWAWFAVLLLAGGLLLTGVFRSERLAAAFQSFLEKIGLVSMVYLAISLCGLIILVGRNLARV